MDTDYIKMMYQYDLMYGNGKTHVEMAFNGKTYLDLDFQDGAVKEDTDINGCTIEDLLVLAHARLNYFQKCLPDYHNEMALKHIEEALLDLSSRMTARRIAGVESTDKNVDYMSTSYAQKSEVKVSPSIISKLANVEIADKNYTEGDKKRFTYDEALEIEKKLNNGWRLPTRKEWALICEEFACGSDGRLDSKLLTKNLGLDKKGYVFDGSLYSVGCSGYYWSRTVDSGTSQYAYHLYFNSSNVLPAYNDYRYRGFSVRLVRDL